jgi:hypothetical protein
MIHLVINLISIVDIGEAINHHRHAIKKFSLVFRVFGQNKDDQFHSLFRIINLTTLAGESSRRHFGCEKKERFSRKFTGSFLSPSSSSPFHKSITDKNHRIHFGKEFSEEGK